MLRSTSVVLVFFEAGCVVNLVTETLFGGRQKLRRARSSRAFAHGAYRDIAEGVRTSRALPKNAAWMVLHGRTRLMLRLAALLA